MDFHGFNFFDFDDLAVEECQQIEAILLSSSSAVQFPWSFRKAFVPDVAVIAGGPSHYFSPNQMPGHVLPTPVQMYPCPGPPIVPVLTYPHNVVLGPGGMYVSVVPMPTSLSNHIVSTNFPYHPVTMASVNGTVYPSQQIMMGPVDPQFSSCPVTMPCPSAPVLVNPVMQEPMLPVTPLYVPPAGESAVEDIDGADSDTIVKGLPPQGSPSFLASETRGEEVQEVGGDLPDELSGQDENLIESEQRGSDTGSVSPPESSRSGIEMSKSQSPSDDCKTLIDSTGDISKIKSGSTSPIDKGLPPQGSPSATDARRPSMASEMPAVGDGRNVQNGPPPTLVEPEVQKPKSWASLLHNTTSAANAIVVSANEHSPVAAATARKGSDAAEDAGKSDKQPPGETGLANAVPLQEDKVELMTMLKNHTVTHRSVYLQPRGLTNRANWCYVNATLQALLACPPFYHLVKQISTIKPNFWEVSNFPAMKCMTHLVNEFPVVSLKSLDKQGVNAKGGAKIDLRCGPAFEPVFVYKMLQAIDYEAFKLNQQEDAEEFLSCILNRLHDEMVNAMKQLEGGDKRKEEIKKSLLVNGDRTSKAPADEGDDDTRWEQVRARNRTVYSSTTGNECSPISAIFRGQICCILHQFGQKESATLQPFFTLQLDVQNEKVKSVQDALEQLVSKESLHGYTCTKSNVEVDATQRTMIEELPPVLVLHLKWFHYDKNGGLQKRIKQVDFDIDLELSKDLLSSHAKARTQSGQRRYKLFAVVSHIGVRAIGGHYIVDVFHPGYNCWLRCDDNNITSIPASLVTKFNSPKVPYLILYRCFERS